MQSSPTTTLLQHFPSFKLLGRVAQADQPHVDWFAFPMILALSGNPFLENTVSAYLENRFIFFFCSHWHRCVPLCDFLCAAPPCPTRHPPFPAPFLLCSNRWWLPKTDFRSDHSRNKIRQISDQSHNTGCFQVISGYNPRLPVSTGAQCRNQFQKEQAYSPQEISSDYL